MNNKRLIALLLCAVMLLSLLPMAVFAEGEYAEDEIIEEEAAAVPEEETAQEEVIAEDEIAEEPVSEADDETDAVIEEEEPAAADEEIPAEETSAEEPAEDIPDEPETGEDENEFEATASGSCGANLTWKLLDTGTLIIEGTGTMFSGKLLGDKVLGWKDYDDDITSVRIESGVTSIGAYAFNNCKNITSIKIASSVTSIETGAFRKCEGITSINLPSGVTAIPDSCFQNCSELSSIALPTKVTGIGASAFADCSKLASVEIPTCVTSIGESAFSKCSQLSAITLPSGITEIPNSCFASCSMLGAITFPNKLSSIGTNAFFGCTKLTALSFPSSVKSIGSIAFSGCSAVKTISFLGKAPTIGNYAFLGVTAEANYPLGDSTWTADVQQNYGGTLTWKAVKKVYPAPEISSVDNHADYMIIRWTALEEATGYKLAYRAGSEAWKFMDVPLSAVDSSGNPRVNLRGLTVGATYTFIAYAYFPDGSATKSASVPQVRLLSPAVTVTRYSSSILEIGGFKISWDATDGGSCYKVYYREKGGSWALYTMINKDKNTLYCNIRASVAKANASLPDLVSGKTYEFAVLTATSQANITSGFPTKCVTATY